MLLKTKKVLNCIQSAKHGGILKDVQKMTASGSFSIVCDQSQREAGQMINFLKVLWERCSDKLFRIKEQHKFR